MVLKRWVFFLCCGVYSQKRGLGEVFFLEFVSFQEYGEILRIRRVGVFRRGFYELFGGLCRFDYQGQGFYVGLGFFGFGSVVFRAVEFIEGFGRGRGGCYVRGLVVFGLECVVFELRQLDTVYGDRFCGERCEGRDVVVSFIFVKLMREWVGEWRGRCYLQVGVMFTFLVREYWEG